MLKKTLLLIVLFLLSLVFFLAALMPASLFWEKAIKPNVNLSSVGLKVKGIEGTLWDGKALLDYEQLPILIDWDLDLGSIALGKLELILDGQAHGGEFAGKLSAGLSDIDLLVSKLNLELAELNRISRIKRHRVKLGGELIAKDLSVSVLDNQVTHASGIVSWSGGDIAYPAGRQLRERNMPSFRGVVATREDGMVELNVTDSQGSFSVIEGSLLPDGLAQLQVRRRLLDLAEEPWSQNSSEQDVVFKVKKSIY